MEKSEPITFLPFVDDSKRRLDSPNPIGERVSKKFEGGGFIATPSYSDVTGLREANAELKREVDALKGRVQDLERVVQYIAEWAGLWENFEES